MGMRGKLNFGLLSGAAAVLCLAALGAAWFRQSNVESAGSVTVKLPPAQPMPKPQFSFR
jgi:hypothetical protein